MSLSDSLALRPALSALFRNRSGAILVTVQIAIALAVLVNALAIVQQRLEKMDRPARIDDANLFGLYSVEYTQRFHYDASLHEDLTYLRSLPGVLDATPTNSVPFGDGGSNETLSTLPDGRGISAGINIFLMDEHGLGTLGVKLLAGRNFHAEEILPAQTRAQGHQIIITQAAARRLFPHASALGQSVYDGKDAMTIIGIIDDMIGTGREGVESPVQVAIFPRLAHRNGHGYLVRTAPGKRDAIMRQVQQHLASSNQDRVITDVQSLEDNKRLLYAADSLTAGFLITVTALIVTVTALGVFSLATFNVTRRTRQIGTRRAVGARRRDIVSQFLIENALMTAAGIVLGCLLALGIGSWLSAAYALPRLDPLYLAGGVLAIGVIGQLAAWWPARRAATVPPSVATRNI